MLSRPSEILPNEAGENADTLRRILPLKALNLTGDARSSRRSKRPELRSLPLLKSDRRNSSNGSHRRHPVEFRRRRTFVRFSGS